MWISPESTTPVPTTPALSAPTVTATFDNTSAVLTVSQVGLPAGAHIWGYRVYDGVVDGIPTWFEPQDGQAPGPLLHVSCGSPNPNGCSYRVETLVGDPAHDYTWASPMSAPAQAQPTLGAPTIVSATTIPSVTADGDDALLDISNPTLPANATVWGYQVNAIGYYNMNFEPVGGLAPDDPLRVPLCSTEPTDCTYEVRTFIGDPTAGYTWISPWSDPVQVSTGATAPSAPIAVTAVGGSNSVSLSFVAPDEDGGDPIKNYTATCTSSDGGVPGSASGPTSPLLVTGLTAGSTYTCTVFATNDVGDGPDSDPSDPVLTDPVSIPPPFPTAYDFNGDGKADPAVYRSGAWYIKGQATQFLGLASDLPVPADYTTDGPTELAVFRPSVGGWYISGRATQYLGLNGDIPVPGDYNGTGVAEIGVFRPAIGGWYIAGQATQFVGLSTDVPVPANYNGDAHVEVGVFRPAVGGWYIAGQATQFVGLSTDTPVPNDYTGVGTAQVGVFRPAVGGWYISGLATRFLGLGTDIPVAADYNGAGHAAAAVFRSGTWYMAGQPTVYLGTAGDIPVDVSYAIRAYHQANNP